MNTKTLLLVGGAFLAGGILLQVPGLLSQARGAKLNGDMIDIGISVVGFAACAICMMVKRGKARNSGQ